jgi:hypothetical protein
VIFGLKIEHLATLVWKELAARFTFAEKRSENQSYDRELQRQRCKNLQRQRCKNLQRQRCKKLQRNK